METMMNLPLVSIVTPSFNQGKFIERTLRSIKNQRHSHLEHFVIDAGSKDETLAILKKYKGSYNLKWISEPDKGMYDAINKGLRMAQGEILAYLNTDDCYFPWTVETAVDHLLNDHETDLVFGDHLNCFEDGRMTFHIQPPYRLKLYRRTGWSLPQPTVFWRRKVYEALGGFDSQLKICGDWDFWMRAASQFKITQIREFLAVMHLHRNQKTAALLQELFREQDMLLHRYSPPPELTGWRKFLELKGYAWFWQRICSAQFLISYLLRRKGYPTRLWPKFLNDQGVIVGPWNELLRGFLPFGHRGKDRWVVSSSYQWLRDENAGFSSSLRHEAG